MNNSKYIGDKDMYSTVQEMLQTPRGWDVVILQDHSRGPAESDTREKSKAALESEYAPMLKSMEQRAGKMPVILLYQTWAYEKSNMPWSFDDFTHRLIHGYADYERLLSSLGFDVVVARVAEAVAKVHEERHGLWRKLYAGDHFHPNALLTYLASSHIATAISRHPNFSARLRAQMHVAAAWPCAQRCHPRAASASAADLALLLETAGPAGCRVEGGSRSCGCRWLRWRWK